MQENKLKRTNVGKNSSSCSRQGKMFGGKFLSVFYGSLYKNFILSMYNVQPYRSLCICIMAQSTTMDMDIERKAQNVGT